MGYKFGIILSLVFVVFVFIFCSDLLNVQAIYSELDSLSLTAGQLISRNGGITQEIENFALENNSSIYCLNEGCQNVRFGDTIYYIIQRKYDPLIMSKDIIDIKIKRSVVIGYYN